MKKKKLRRKTQDVLTNRNLISKESANSPSIARRYAKGIVLSQKIGFNQGTFASLKDLKNFYRKLNEGKAPSYSLIVRRAIDLLNYQVANFKNHSDIYKEKEVFSTLVDLGRKGKGGSHDYQ